MEILVLGGTGAMGVPLVEKLAEKHKVYVTSRSRRESKANVEYLQGDAKNDEFLLSLMNRKYDVIFDFMVYQTEQFRKRLSILLDHTKQYFFFSSARCYADSLTPISENTPRLVDCCKDEDYISLDEYGMSKGREENLLIESNRKNWTIIRPYITYNTYRLQLGVYEKENWLKRMLTGKTVIFPRDIASKKTSLTYALDVIGAVEKLIGNEKAYGEAFHITTSESHTWGEILEFYCDEVERIIGKRPKVKYVDNSEELQTVWNKWQIKYDRLFDREFDNSKMESISGKYQYKSTFEGLRSCLEEFISKPKWLEMNIVYEAWCDRQCGEWTSMKEFPRKKDKLRYLKYRILG